MDNTIKTGEGQESTDNCQLSIASCPLKRIALFPGTFDPFTIGHESLVSRGLELVDEIIISIGINDTKRTYFSLEKAGGDPRALQGRTARTGHVVRLPDGRFRPTDECRVYPARYSYGERFRI